MSYVDMYYKETSPKSIRVVPMPDYSGVPEYSDIPELPSPVTTQREEEYDDQYVTCDRCGRRWDVCNYI